MLWKMEHLLQGKSILNEIEMKKKTATPTIVDDKNGKFMGQTNKADIQRFPEEFVLFPNYSKLI